MYVDGCFNIFYVAKSCELFSLEIICPKMDVFITDTTWLYFCP